jgi:hypothetical protein
MVHRSMRNDSRVVDELYIKRVLLALEDSLLFSLYSFSCIAKQVTTLKQLRLLSCLNFLETNLEPLVLFCVFTLVLPISPTPDPARYSMYAVVPEICHLFGQYCISSYLGIKRLAVSRKSFTPLVGALLRLSIAPTWSSSLISFTFSSTYSLFS